MSIRAWGWNEYFQREYSRLGMEGVPARVVTESQGIYRVAAEHGEVATRARRGQEPVAGDWVVLAAAAGPIEALLPRRTCVSRKRAGRETEEQVLAANVDVLFIVTSLDGDFSLRRLERYLVVAEEGGAQPVLLLNKADQCEQALERLAEVDALTRGLTPAVLTSALDGGGVDQLHRFVEPGQTAALIGSSGVGKSTIVNRLLGHGGQAVAPVRESDSKGRHTTTGRHLFPLPAGWLLLDTPGLREIEPWAAEASVDAVFGEIVETGLECRFRDCRHEAEPGCAVRAALERGQIDAARLRNFQTLKGAMSELEKKRKWRVIHRAMRRMPDKRDGGG